MHQPVMLKEVIGSLNLKSGDIVVDATVGGGGHAKEILKNILPGGRLVGIDADGSALSIAKANLKDFNSSYKLINDNFRHLDNILAKEDIKKIDAIFFDLGVSSFQLEDDSRGFGIRHGGRLDMRMDGRLNITAYDIINKYKERELSNIIEKFGEERFHNRIARFIVDARSKRPIETAGELVSIIHRAVGSRYGRMKIDPATRTFQAIRITVNDELLSLEDGLKKAIAFLDSGARICVISFHSLEDRIVKNLFRNCSKIDVLKIITKKPLRPSQEEMVYNPRSRSAKLRVAERI